MLGTMMLANDEVHGLVSGAVHSTANTIRPALQIIKTTPGSKVVSSVFFML
jgi:phosphate acetyltransferase